MAVQTRSDIDSKKFFLGRQGGVTKMKEVIAQDAGRGTPLAQFTLMAKVAASGKWTPFINAAATDGTAIPQGIYTGDEITAAALVAGDIPDCMILVYDMEFDESMLVIENSKTLDTVVTVGTTDLRSVRDHLLNHKLLPRLTNTSTAQENT